MSLTIFEGCDGSGKTTLAAAFKRRAENRGRTIYDSNHGPYLGLTGDDITTRYAEDLIRAAPPSTLYVLMDRCWISESIYGPVARSVDRLGVVQRRMLERLALAAGAIVVLCLPPYDQCRSAYMERRHLEYLTDETQLRKVYDGFANTANQLFPYVLPLYIYDWTRELHRGTYIEMLEDERPNPNEGPGVGRYGPGVTLMVVDQTFPPIETCRQAVLTQRLEEWGISESTLYWVDALNARGRETSSAYWLEKLNPRRVVALNAIAAAWCRKAMGDFFIDCSGVDYGRLKEVLCTP